MSGFSRVFSAELYGIDAKIIEVETDINVGLHSFNVVGLADRAVNEAKERVSAAIKNSGARPPNKENRRITVNLAPADVKKNGSQYDLAMAIGYLLASGQMKSFAAEKFLFAGELSLEGEVRSVAGALCLAEAGQKRGFEKLIISGTNAKEAAMIKGIQVIPINTLTEAILFLEGQKIIPAETNFVDASDFVASDFPVDIGDIRGQEHAKRALLVAACGGHHLLMTGTPGAGKTMLAQSLIAMLPPADPEETIEITKIWSATGIVKNGAYNLRPFRFPHHTTSAVAMVGGGPNPRPGEISLAHRGVLFLDELPEFHRDILEALREPMESGHVCVSRASGALNFPAKFMLVAAMNPCPCGYFGDEEKVCHCSAGEIHRYQKKLSGPLLDRIDIQIEVSAVKIEELRRRERDESAGRIFRKSVTMARSVQRKRFDEAGVSLRLNTEMSSRDTEKFCFLEKEVEEFLSLAAKKMALSARGYYRVLKISRTIADMEESENIKIPHLAEALGYRLRAREE